MIPFFILGINDMAIDQYLISERFTGIVATYAAAGRGQISYWGGNYFLMNNSGEEDNALELWKRPSNGSTFLFQKTIAAGGALRGLCNDGKFIYSLESLGSFATIRKFTIDGMEVDVAAIASGDNCRGLTCDSNVGTNNELNWGMSKYLYTMWYDTRGSKWYMYQYDWNKKKVVKQTFFALTTNFERPIELTFNGKNIFIISDNSLACVFRQLSLPDYLNMKSLAILDHYDGVTFDGKYFWLCQE